MRIIKGLRNIKAPVRGSVVTIGVFDGVHIGHVKVIRETVVRAKRLNAESIVLTFDPHPFRVLHPAASVPSLISLEHRLKLIKELGVDTLVVVNFTKTIAELSPRAFIYRILVARCNAREVCVSKKFYFGRKAEAGVDELERIASQFGIKVRVIDSVKIKGRAIGSSAIRYLVRQGHLAVAAKLLGRPVSVLGTVVAGIKLATKLGYPTANINPHHEVIPSSGVYAVRVDLDGKRLGGVLNIGTKPTFYSPRDREPTIEVHIFDFKGNLYGKEIEVFFVKKLRDELKFRDTAKLIEQIRKDVDRAKKVLKGR